MDFSPGSLEHEFSDEEEDDVTEIEAELYSKIYYEQSPDTQSRDLVTEFQSNEGILIADVNSDSGIVSFRENCEDDSIATVSADIQVNGSEPDNGTTISSKESSHPSDPNVTANATKFNVNEFISEVFDDHLRKQNMDDDDSDSETDNNIIVANPLGVPEETRYTSVAKSSNAIAGSGQSTSESISSDEDEGIQIIREVDAARERSLRAELVDLVSDGEDSELELQGDNLCSKKASKSMLSARGAPINSLKQEDETSTQSKPNDESFKSTRQDQQPPRAGKVTVEVEKTARRTPHFVARRNTSSDDSSSSSDSDENVAGPSKMSLNLTGGNFGRSRETGGFKTFAEITGCDPQSVNQSRAGGKKLGHWTKEMSKFYDDIDPYLADVNLETLLSTIPKDANWSLGVRDRYSTPGSGQRRNSRYFNSPNFLNCSTCGQRGHRANTCRRGDKNQRRCFMCGGEDHSKFSCPKMKCLRCGHDGMPYTSTCIKCQNVADIDCHHCGGRGHLARHCSDHWRRYHLTTSPGAIVVPEETRLDHSNVWCPNCSRRGHLVHQCRAFTSSLHPKNLLTVVSYEETRKRRIHPAEGYTPETVSEPSSAKRRRFRRELKEKQRAFKSFPHTPTSSHLSANRNQSAPPSPGISDFNLTVFDVTRNLNEAKKKLTDLSDKGQKRKKNKKRMKKIERQNLKNFSRKSHEPQPFPRELHRKPRMDFRDGQDNEPTARKKRSKARFLEWKQRYKFQQKKTSKPEDENFLKI